jgi:hypothetical protein
MPVLAKIREKCPKSLITSVRERMARYMSEYIAPNPLPPINQVKFPITFVGLQARNIA